MVAVDRTSKQGNVKSLTLAADFCLGGTFLGFIIGVAEAILALVHQRYLRLTEPGVSEAIFFFAPPVDALTYCVLGLILGISTGISRRKGLGGTIYFVALGLAIAGGQLFYLGARSLIHFNEFHFMANVGIGLIGSVSLAALTVKYGGRIWPRIGNPDSWSWPVSRSRIMVWAFFAGAGLASAGILAMPARVPRRLPQLSPIEGEEKRPNLVLIALDTARADHFSALGYPRLTTPNLDDLAKKGVIFENAVASTSYSLPSFATVLTGLLPHQDETTLDIPLPTGIPTLASILRSRGYQTAGFNANFTQGTVRTGLAKGFEFYSDDDSTMRSSLFGIDTVKVLYFLIYYPFIQPRYFAFRNAQTLNQTVFDWFDRHPRVPYFLFINYFDPHEPYSSIRQIGNRFGDAQTTITHRIRAEVDGQITGIEVPNSPHEQDALIAGYDSALAFTDVQIGNLLHHLESARELANTYVIVFGDHGQAFGTHHHYGHGWGLNWELLHVPLIIAGPGIPQGRRIRDVVGLQQLFATVFDLVGENTGVSAASSLRCYWAFSQDTCEPNPMVVSELGPMAMWKVTNPSVSIVTPRWHLIRDAADDVQLYNWTVDPGELVNLAGSPDYQAEVATLENRIFEKIERSALPWRGEEYLWALGKRQFSLLVGRHLVHSWPSHRFSHAPANQPETPDNELLHSLPYQ